MFLTIILQIQQLRNLKISRLNRRNLKNYKKIIKYRIYRNRSMAKCCVCLYNTIYKIEQLYIYIFLEDKI